ncbi:MAG: serine/threonine-protein kinase, partial [Planctomycetota bacterium]|nr:serine/threonine-protein kinase [Planctomycetota bacterium]
MQLRTSPIDVAEPAGNGSGQFLYASGSRPLAGYTIKRGIGHGGFGEVYYAVSDAGKEVALKLIRRNLEIEIRGVTQCLNLKHPNLLALFDIRQSESDENWVVMEFVAGDALDEVIAAHPDGMPVAEALRWFHGVAAGVAYLHDHGVVHRDLKPGNVFSDEGIVKIGDYGLSKFISCSRRSGQTGSVGTVHYMAPEVANGRYGKEIDIYALGVMLYEMLTGHVPFEGESIGEVLMKHLTAAPDVSRLAEPYRTVVARALAKDPAKRFHHVMEMVAVLNGTASDVPAQNSEAVAQAATPPLADAVNEAVNAATSSQPFLSPDYGPNSATFGGAAYGSSDASSPPYQSNQTHNRIEQKDQQGASGSQQKPVDRPIVSPIKPGSFFDEPVAQSVMSALQEGWRSWEKANIDQATRTAIIIGAVVVFAFTFGLWVFAGFFSVGCYIAYRLGRGVINLFRDGAKSNNALLTIFGMPLAVVGSLVLLSVFNSKGGSVAWGGVFGMAVVFGALWI